jgi:4-amino-4-deoxy-L-arabinose transferase-like glycosyltransferase
MASHKVDQFRRCITVVVPWLGLAAIVTLWCLGVAMVNPVGDFPLNDDWSWGMAVKRLLDEGAYRPLRWTGMPLFSQVLWGAAFCLPFGFSFSALRLSTLVLSLLGVLCMYIIVRRLGGSRWLAVACALTLCFNPIYFALSHTFMTDVPFTTFALGASLFFVRYIQTSSSSDLLLATLLVATATLCRQLGICVPFAFGTALLIKHGFARRWVLVAVTPFAVSLGSLAALHLWLTITGNLSDIYQGIQIESLRAIGNFTKLCKGLIRGAQFAVPYLGLFSLPLTIVTLFSSRRFRQSPTAHFLFWCTAALYLAGSTAVIATKGALMPFSGNIITRQGIGPFTLYDTFILNLPNVPSIPSDFWIAVTAASLLGGALLVGITVSSAYDLVSKVRASNCDDSQIVAIFFLLCSATYLFALFTFGFNDRYLVPAVPFILGYVAALIQRSSLIERRLSYVTVGLLLVVLAVFSVCGTRDYLEWNRCRWSAINDTLRHNHARVQDVDGGYEFNGWYVYDDDCREMPLNNLYSVPDATYVIAFGSVPGYQCLKRYEYSHWFPRYMGSIAVLKR